MNEYNEAQSKAMEQANKGKGQSLPGKTSSTIKKPTYSTKVKK